MGKSNFARKFSAGFVLLIMLIMLMSVFGSAICATNTNDLPIDDRYKAKNTEFRESDYSKTTPRAKTDNGISVLSSGDGVDLKNQAKKIHVAISNSSRLGKFAMGGYYNEQWQKLLYGYPSYGSTSYLTIRVENATASVNYTNTMMDPYVVEHVHWVGEDAVSMKWRLPDDIVIEQNIRLVQDFARIEIDATNEGSSTKKIGVRYYYDTMVAWSDRAPIYIPGVGVKTTQEEYVNPTFTYWKGYDHPTVPTVVSEAKISGDDATSPDKLQIDQYKSSAQTWENYVSPGSSFSDSAVITYWNPRDVAQGQSKQVVTYYGIGAPVARGPFNISEVLVDRVDGNYCPDETVKVKVDVISIGENHDGSVKIDILDDGDVMYSSPVKHTGAVPADGATTVEFYWTVDVEACGKSLDIKASLLNSSNLSLIDEMTKSSMIIVNPSCPGCAPSAYKFDVHVTPESVTASIGGNETFKVEIYNSGLVAGNFTINVTGLPTDWFNLEESATFLTAGEYEKLDLIVHVPDSCDVSGNYQLNVSVTRSDTGEIKSDLSEIVVVSNPIISELLPSQGNRLGSCDVLFTWKTLVNSTTVLYLKSEDEPQYEVYLGDPSLYHAVTVYGLERNKQYDYYVMSKSTCGESSSEVRTFFVDNGISFRQRTYSFSIERDYNQQVVVSVENTDSEPHDLLAAITNPYNDLYVGFVGDGSSDSIIPLNPGERKDIQLVVHAQDVTEEDYTLAMNITSTDATETLSDFADVHIHVHIPVINFSISEVSSDPLTLIKKFKVINYGDTLTDFSVYADDSIKNNVMFQPSMNHYNLRSGTSVEFDVIPIFSSESQLQSTTCTVCAAGTSELSGNIHAKGAGVSKSAPANFDCPDGEQVYCVTLHNVGILRKMNDWYCTNRPDIDMKFDVPSGFGSANVKEATLRMNFNPDYTAEKVTPHDVDVYINGHEIGSLSNTVPKGVSEFEINPSYLKYASAGKADNKIGLKTEHMNGGHYVVSSDAVIHACVDNLVVCVCAPNEEEAINRAIKISYLEASLSSISVSILEPTEGQEVMIGDTVDIKVHVTGDGSSADDLMATAYFGNGDEVQLLSVGGGNYEGQWTVENIGIAPAALGLLSDTDTNTGEYTIIASARTCEASGEATRKGKMISPDALHVFISKPEYDFCKQKNSKVLIKAEVNYYDISKSEKCGAVKSDDLKKIEAEIDDETMSLSDTGEWDTTANDGIYTGIWTPKETGDYTIKVTAEAKKSGVEDGKYEIEGIIIARPNLTIKPPAGCNYKDVDPNGKTVIAPVFQRGVGNPDFEITNLSKVPSKTKLIVEIKEPQRDGSYRLVKNLEISKNHEGKKLIGKWDWSARDAGDIPIGKYKAQARLIRIKDGKPLLSSEKENFSVIFDHPSKVSDFYLDPTIAVFESDIGKGRQSYKLHVKNPKVWKSALGEINGETNIAGAVEKLTKYVGSKVTSKKTWSWDVLKLRDKGWFGCCVDYSGLLIAYSRAVGIPARSVGGYGESLDGHNWAELYYNSEWRTHEPTWVNEFGPAVNDRRFQCIVVRIVHKPEYPMTFSPTSYENLHDRYNLNMSLDARFKPNDRIDVNITNFGTIDFDDSIDTKFDDIRKDRGVSTPYTMFDDKNHELRLDTLCESKEWYIAPEWRGYIIQNTTYIPPSADLKCGSRYKVVDIPGPTHSGEYTCKFSLYYLPNVALQDRKALIADLTKDYTHHSSRSSSTQNTLYSSSDLNSAFWDISPILTVDSHSMKLNESTSLYVDIGDNRTFVREEFIDPQNISVVVNRDKNKTDDFAKDKYLIENTDETNHTYILEIPYVCEGNAVYIPGFGELTSDTQVGINADYIVVYNRSVTNEDICANARPLTLGAAAQDAIDPIGDVDWWKVEVPTTDCPQILNVTLDGPDDQDFDLYVYDNCDSEDYLCAPLEWDADETCSINATPGTYYIKIEGYENSTGDYTIHTSIPQNNDYCYGAIHISSGYHGVGWISPAGDRDWWKMNTTYDGNLEINLYGPADQDFDLYLYDSCDATEPLCAPLELDANETCIIDVTPGTYYIKVEGYGDSTGYYEVWWSEIIFSSSSNQSQSASASTQTTSFSVNETEIDANPSPSLKENKAHVKLMRSTLDSSKISAEVSPSRNITIFAFSNNARINNVSFDDSFGTRFAKIMVSWNKELKPRSTTDFFTYCEYKNTTEGSSFQELYENFVDNLQKKNNTFLSMSVSSANNIQFNEILPVNVTLQNSGINPENATLLLNITKTWIGFQENIYTDKINASISPKSSKIVTFLVNCSENSLVGGWDIIVDTDKDMWGRAAATVHDAFDLGCTQNITVEQYQEFTFNATITNRWGTTVHDINVTIELFYGFNTSESLEKHICTLLPGESRTMSWQLSATSSGELPIDVLVTSDNGGYGTASSIIMSLSPPVLWIPNIITHTDALGIGTNKTVVLNVTIQNGGDLTAHNVQIQLLLPENVTSTVLTHDIGDLVGGEQKNVSIDVTFSTQKDFAFDVVAKDDANHIATGIIMISQYGEEDVFDTGSGTYPSIMGTHRGVIKPGQDINVSKMYTYPCPGTSGHSEYVWIHGNSINVSVMWRGYQDAEDYHCIEFPEPFTLQKGATYYYTIRTDSYPQIRHTDALQTATGWINCTEFTDVNGRIYYDWIPAIRLFN